MHALNIYDPILLPLHKVLQTRGHLLTPATLALQRCQHWSIPLDHIDVHPPLQLAQADGTQPKRLGLTLPVVVVAIHQTLELDAVRETEVVAKFVQQGLYCVSEDLVIERRMW